MRAVLKLTLLSVAAMVVTSQLARAQAIQPPPADASAPAPSIFGQPPLASYDSLFGQHPAGAEPTPRHTGVKTLAKHVVTNFKYLPSMENLLWAAGGGGLALTVHPFDDDVKEHLAGNDT